MNHFEPSELTAPEMVEALSAGASLRIVLEPDPARKANLPRYWETLDLPFVIVAGSHFWGMSYTVHHPSGSAEDSFPNMFCYTSSWRLFASYLIINSIITIMPRTLYSSFFWGLVPARRVIWDSSVSLDESVSPIIEAIRGFKKLHIALFFEEYVFFVPVHFPAYYPETRSFALMTEKQFFPRMFLDPDRDGMNDLERLVYDELAKRDSDPLCAEKNFSMSAQCEQTDSFFSVSSDGTFISPAFGGEKKEYDRLIVLQELTGSINTPYVAEACE